MKSTTLRITLKVGAILEFPASKFCFNRNPIPRNIVIYHKASNSIHVVLPWTHVKNCSEY